MSDIEKIIKYNIKENNISDSRKFYIGRIVQVDLPEDNDQISQWIKENANRVGVVIDVENITPVPELYIMMNDNHEIIHMPSFYFNILTTIYET